MNCGVLRGMHGWCPHDLSPGPSNPLSSRFKHSVTTAITWDQVREFILEPHALLPHPRTCHCPEPSLRFQRQFIRNLREKCCVFNGKDVLYTLQYMWNYARSAIFVSIRRGTLELFVPFCNADYTNTWPDTAQWSFKPSATGLHSSKWWLNGWCLCDQVPDNVWGDHWVTTLRHMVIECCLNIDGDFIINKRDTPLVRRDGGDPMNPFSYRRVVQPSKLLPVFSFYTGPSHLDIACPIGAEWAHRCKLLFPQARPHVPEPDAVDVYWPSKEDLVVFRGSTTGTGQRALVFACKSKYLDAKCTSNNRRRVVDPVSLKELYKHAVQSSKANFMSMNAQQAEYKMTLCVNGHSAPDRMFRLFNGTQMVLMLRCNRFDLGQEVWFSHMLQPWLHYVPIRHDCEGIDHCVQWLLQNDRVQSRMLKACGELPIGRDAIREWWQWARFQKVNARRK